MQTSYKKGQTSVKLYYYEFMAKSSGYNSLIVTNVYQGFRLDLGKGSKIII